jgi:hypothetical protein
MAEFRRDMSNDHKQASRIAHEEERERYVVRLLNVARACWGGAELYCSSQTNLRGFEVLSNFRDRRGLTQA